MCVKKTGGTYSLEQRGHADLLAFLCPHDRSVPALPTVWRVHPQVDGNWGDAFVGPRDPVGLRFDLLSNFIKVCKLFGLAVQKLGIFCKGKKDAQKRNGLAVGGEQTALWNRSFASRESEESVTVALGIWGAIDSSS